MSASTTAGSILPPERQQSGMRHPWVVLVVRRRVFLSLVIFTGMIVSQVVRGIQPRDVTNGSDPYVLLGLLLVFLGLGLRSWAVGILRKGTELATMGPYRLSRNPQIGRAHV